MLLEKLSRAKIETIISDLSDHNCQDDLIKDIARYLDPDSLAFCLLGKVEQDQQPHDQGLRSSVFRHQSDWSLITQLLPGGRDFLRPNQDPSLSFALTFLLRHSVSRLNLMLHYLAGGQGLEVAVSDQLTDLVRSLYSGDIPVVGFDPTGILWRPATKGRCRIIDRYEASACAEPRLRNSIFCSEHNEERWWQQKEVRLSQSKMFQFYCDQANLHSYSSEQLKEMLGKFWHDYKTHRHSFEKEDISAALLTFGIASIDDLTKLANGALKKRYQSLCLQYHPDLGGKTEDFTRLKSHYDVLSHIHPGS